MSEQIYKHSEITNYAVELFLKDFHTVFYEHINKVVTSTDNVTRKEARDFLFKCLKQYLGEPSIE